MSDTVFILGEPGGLRTESWKTFTARGRVADCDCNMIQCVCLEARQHINNCLYRKSLLSAIDFPCEKHGLDACLECDCDCGKLVKGITVTNSKDLGTLNVKLENGRTRLFELRAAVRQGDHVLEVRDAETEGEEVWTIFKFDSAPTSVHLSKAHHE